MNLFIRILNDQIQDVKFRHIDAEVYRPIKDLFELYIKSKNVQDSSIATDEIITENLATSTTNEIISKVSNELVSDAIVPAISNSVVDTLENLPIDSESIKVTADAFSGLF